MISHIQTHRQEHKKISCDQIGNQIQITLLLIDIFNAGKKFAQLINMKIKIGQPHAQETL